MEYKCLTRDRLGKVTSNVVRGRDVPTVVASLKKEGYLPLKVEAVRRNGRFGVRSLFRCNEVKLKEIVIFTRQLAATLSAGLVLVEALDVVADEMDNKYFQSVIQTVRSDIQGGTDFSTALSRHPKVFNNGYVSLVRAGEVTGRLYKSMTDLAQYQESTLRLREKVKSAMSYPLFVLSFAFLVVAVVVLFLIPKFRDIFDSIGAELPMMTQMVVGVSEVALKWWPFVLVGLVAIAIGIRQSLRIPVCREFMDNVMIRLPLVGKEVIHKSLLSKFCHTLGALLSGDVALATSLDITARVVNHIPMSKAINRVKERVMAGAYISDELRTQPIFPKLVAKMITVGERTGTTSEMLRRTAVYYDEELDNTLQKLTSMIEPALILFIGGFICVVIVALYLPIFKVTQLVM